MLDGIGIELLIHESEGPHLAIHPSKVIFLDSILQQVFLGNKISRPVCFTRVFALVVFHVLDFLWTLETGERS